MTSNAGGQQSDASGVAVSGATSSLWLRLLFLSSTAAALALALASVVAAVMNGGQGAFSAIFGGALVMAFFAVSLLIGHFVGRDNPSGAVGLFVATYFVKVVGFAAVLFLVGTPAWLHGRWFLIGAVVAVISWQAAEIRGFSKARLRIYNDPATGEDGNDVHP